jgi:hypothetical protein
MQRRRRPIKTGGIQVVLSGVPVLLIFPALKMQGKCRWQPLSRARAGEGFPSFAPGSGQHLAGRCNSFHDVKEPKQKNNVITDITESSAMLVATADLNLPDAGKRKIKSGLVIVRGLD